MQFFILKFVKKKIGNPRFFIPLGSFSDTFFIF